jgi:zinc transport system ATP-binding protein
MMEILNLQNVGVKLGGNVILSGVDFSASEKEIIALIGPNGAGKTMLIKAILGLVPSSGKIEIFGEERSLSVGKIGYVPQRFSFDRSFPITVHEFISLTAKGESDKMGILKEFGLERLHDRQIGSLSGGEMQRVLVARAVMDRPKLLLLDEATSGIDVEGVKDFYEMIEIARSRYGMTIVMISHEINAVYKFADRIVCLNRNMVCYGKPDEALTPETIEKLYGREVGIREHHHDHNK